MQTYDIITIGGGAAGMMAALFAARSGARVLLLERNEKLGKKIYITGKGRCNLTNAAEPEEFMQQIIRNPRFMHSALAHLSNQDTMALFESLGVPLKQERGARIFPVSDHASDITRALERELLRLGVRVQLNARVHSLAIEDDQLKGVLLPDGKLIPARAVILATGGLSYASTGSTGDGHQICAQLGHPMKETYPALTAIETREPWPRTLMGLTLKNISLSAPLGKKKRFHQQGELLFTHFGISGPLVLSLSSMLPMPADGIEMAIDLKPALSEQELDARILRDFSEMPNRQLMSAMDKLTPHALGVQLLELLQLSPAQPIHSVSQTQRRAIVSLLKHLPLTVSRL
ncbi:aminoacetone oxidase family FAD-binding enzyme, partial [Eubacteriales bacterium OttesenSCG-928-N13]|nr:aminoacetone oxidase family FAD-binding enzyme [Eubacteriales bacterium OttesenSCG-928-N13]